ncbi:hypothetical protein HYH03_010747 [Edaphochlamys debaryana]|uniref:Uncharacterized protein n=1 Tax=Edaphochlamys debaryana TaxID=47281 RepID=A0A836BVN4_9CHLO|nr:hypothetical protein HYH03_010747 [Edaphochlamys debaryana]|eukprot:KAG2490826.1 hypothetical protein HYH03_010747 [Edaphochlamys debaryana]
MAPLGALLEWKAVMAGRIEELGDSWEAEDGGPGKEGLLRELDWVLDDVIESSRPSPSAPWEGASWRTLEPAVRAARYRGQDPGAWELRLRAAPQALWEWWERRLRDRVPFQYLIGSAHWHAYVLAVGPGVLIPRPETEIFPDLVRQALAERPGLAALPWADLGTGSGAIAISAADELRRRNPAAEVWAVDLSPVAAAFAAFNADSILAPPPPRAAGGTAAAASTTPPASSSTSAPTPATGSSSASAPASASGQGPAAPRQAHVRVVRGSWFEPLRHLRGRLGGVLSNPPYIPRAQMRGLQAEVGRHEPHSALDGGEGPGLDSLQELCAEVACMLAPGGLVALETAGGEQADQVADMLRCAPEPGAGAGAGEGAGGGGPGAAFERVEVLEDCYGVRRFVRAYRRGG